MAEVRNPPPAKRNGATPDTAAAEIAMGQTLEAVARTWHGKKSRGWTPRFAGQAMQRLESSIFPELGPRPGRNWRS